MKRVTYTNHNLINALHEAIEHRTEHKQLYIYEYEALNGPVYIVTNKKNNRPVLTYFGKIVGIANGSE